MASAHRIVARKLTFGGQSMTYAHARKVDVLLERMRGLKDAFAQTELRRCMNSEGELLPSSDAARIWREIGPAFRAQVEDANEKAQAYVSSIAGDRQPSDAEDERRLHQELYHLSEAIAFLDGVVRSFPAPVVIDLTNLNDDDDDDDMDDFEVEIVLRSGRKVNHDV